MKKRNYTYLLVVLFYILFIIIMFFHLNLTSVFECVSNCINTNVEANDITRIIEKNVCSNIDNKWDYLDLNGRIAKIIGANSLYNSDNIYITSNGFVESAYNYTTCEYEYEQIVSLNTFLKENDINLLFVNEPTKYIDDEEFIKEFGVETYSNRNMDNFIQKIQEAGIIAIDLREYVKKENIDIQDMFYRTDHHWNTRASLWGTKKIVEGLNTYCGYNIDTSIYDEENFKIVDYENCWLGEQGRKISKTYIGLDDYSSIKPIESCSYVFKYDDVRFDGTFNDFVKDNVYNLENNVYSNESWHYSYSQVDCENNDIEYGKVLLLTDSFGQTTEPFLSLGIHEVNSHILRESNRINNIRDYIINNDYDTVIIAYAQFMLGAHDDYNSANYPMYSFE